MKKIFSFLCLIAAIVVAMSACSSTKEEKGTSETGNAALDNIFARKSVRTYLNKGVEKEKIDLMLRAGMAAPSGKDIRPWEFIVVSDRAKLDSMAAALPYAKMLTQARNAIIVCGDSVRSSYWYLDCSAAAQNILLAAESLGLGAVWTAAYPYEDPPLQIKTSNGALRFHYQHYWMKRQNRPNPSFPVRKTYLYHHLFYHP